MNPKMNGQLQKDWHWLIAIYLFLGGVGAGAYVLAGVSVLLGGAWGQFTDVALSLSWPLVAVGSIFLILDLGEPKNAFRVAAKPGSSWISRGTLIISAFMAVSFLHFAGQVWPFDFARGPANSAATALSIVGILLAFSTMAYTGALLGASKGLPFWRTGVLPPLFIVSALLTGALAVMVGMVAVRDTAIPLHQFHLLALGAAGLILVELFVIFFFLHSAWKLPDSRESALRIVASPSFVVVDLLLGLAVPLVLFLVIYLTSARAETVCPAAIGASILGLIGGLVLRHAVLSGGYLTTLNASGFEFRRICRPKEHAPLGKLPPT
jgi:formate-dependent nitrite reductase membrane component NrfD